MRPRTLPVLDPGFAPTELWMRAYEAQVRQDPGSSPLAIAVTRPDGSALRRDIRILPHEGEAVALNTRYVERLVKTMLWTRGGSAIVIGGSEGLAETIGDQYTPGGERSFDDEVVARRVFLEGMTVSACDINEVPEPTSSTIPVGGHLDGCRIGFDLGGSDRKCAAVIDGTVVHSEEVEWNPYFESDPSYHFDGIMDSLGRAAAHLPRVDAIGGSAAGVYVDNEPRVGSLFRGVSDEDFDREIRPIFRRLRKQWNDVPFVVVNDGEVTALAASMSLGATAPLGIAMGTSLASGFADAHGHISDSLNELAFVPVDLRDDAPVDEWSGDRGCGVQYFSQQAVARLAPIAGIELAEELPFAERLAEIQLLMDRGDERAEKIYRTIGVYLGYSIPWFARWYPLESILLLGRVTSGPGGEIILDEAHRVLGAEFPELADRLSFVTPDETFKRHGQAIAAASLARIKQ
jgi:predicted NBD/HSP70 family sugar kinase